jgi:hypothetical protein
MGSRYALAMNVVSPTFQTVDTPLRKKVKNFNEITENPF